VTINCCYKSVKELHNPTEPVLHIDTTIPTSGYSEVIVQRSGNEKRAKRKG